MQVDFTRLRYFVAVAEELHFKRAADRLMITPPPLSKQIKLLESELGGQLFERRYHDVRLTALGQALLGPARDVLDRVDDLKAMASHMTNGTAAIRIGATAYAPSDFLARLETAVAALTVPAAFSVPGSAAEVTAKLVSGHLDLGLIHLPSADRRIRHRVVASYPGAIAVRFDDPLAAHDSVSIEALRDREVVIDFARPNPVVLAGLTRGLHARGVHRIVRTTNQLGGELEMATQVFNRHLVAVVTYAPASAIGRIFSPPEFKLIPIDENSWAAIKIALAWVPERQRDAARIEALVAEIADRVGTSDAGG
ncbi:LysR family transcriptional regulator [Mycobacterium sp. MBM]|nr:LysR family transcriptional regulator [Mycobacterium sp. MBM]